MARLNLPQTDWENGITPLSAENLDQIESNIQILADHVGKIEDNLPKAGQNYVFDTTLDTRISNHNISKNAHGDIRNDIQNKIDKHNVDSSAHESIRQDIAKNTDDHIALKSNYDDHVKEANNSKAHNISGQILDHNDSPDAHDVMVKKLMNNIYTKTETNDLINNHNESNNCHADIRAKIESYIGDLRTTFRDLESESDGEWLLCDGRKLNITQYQNLFDILGYRYGVGLSINENLLYKSSHRNGSKTIISLGAAINNDNTELVCAFSWDTNIFLGKTDLTEDFDTGIEINQYRFIKCFYSTEDIGYIAIATASKLFLYKSIDGGFELYDFDIANTNFIGITSYYGKDYDRYITALIFTEQLSDSSVSFHFLEFLNNNITHKPIPGLSMSTLMNSFVLYQTLYIATATYDDIAVDLYNLSIKYDIPEELQLFMSDEREILCSSPDGTQILACNSVTDSIMWYISYDIDNQNISTKILQISDSSVGDNTTGILLTLGNQPIIIKSNSSHSSGSDDPFWFTAETWQKRSFQGKQETGYFKEVSSSGSFKPLGNCYGSENDHSNVIPSNIYRFNNKLTTIPISYFSHIDSDSSENLIFYSLNVETINFKLNTAQTDINSYIKAK